MASIVAISEEEGTELIMTFDGSVNQDKYILFLRAIRAKYPFLPCSLFMDRLVVHRTKKVKKKYEELRLHPILNASYSPDYNPAEGAILMTKNEIKLQRWRALQTGTVVDLKELI